MSDHSKSQSLQNTVKYRLVIAYDGTRYAGWQTQKSGLTVQQTLKEALAHLFPSKPRVYGSSRTDAGVHALGLVAHFEIPRTEARLTPKRLLLAINAWLPPDIRVTEVEIAPHNFHARFHAIKKQYRYFVWNHPTMNPLLRFYAWHVPTPLDLEAMRKAAQYFIGKHDFRAFSTDSSHTTKNTIRNLTRCNIRKVSNLLIFIVEADGFLYRMCRGIVGTLVQVGQKKYTPEEIQKMIESKDRRLAGMTAPAHGLVLWQVWYKQNGTATLSEKQEEQSEE